MRLAYRIAASTLVAALLALATPAAAGAKFGFLRQWGSTGSAVGQFNQPFAIAVSPAPDNRVFVADGGNQRIERFDRSGGQAAVIVPPAESGPGHIRYPDGIAADQSQIYVADFNGLHAYSLDGAFAWEKTVNGAGNGELNVPASVSVDPDTDGLLYVADTRNNRIAEFTKGGTWVRNVGKNNGDGTAGTGAGEFTLPVGVLYADGKVWVTEDQSDRLTSMSPTGTDAAFTTATGLKNPKEMARADANNIWVADSVFEDPHLLLYGFGAARGELRGDEPTPGRFGAQGIATDGDGNLFVMDIESDHDDRVLVYGNVPEPRPPPPEEDVCATPAAAHAAETKPCPPKFGTDLPYEAPKPGEALAVPSPTLPRGEDTVSVTAELSGTAPGKLQGALAEPPREWTAQEKYKFVADCWEFGVLMLPRPRDIGADKAGKATIFAACIDLLEKELAKSKPVPAAAGSGCKVSLVPLSRHGRHPTKRATKRLLRHSRRLLDTSCSRSSAGRFTMRLHARGKNGSLRKLFDKRVRVGIARTAQGNDGKNPRLVLRWQRP